MEVGSGEEVEVFLGSDQKECLGLGLGLGGRMLEVKGVFDVVLKAEYLNG